MQRHSIEDQNAKKDTKGRRNPQSLPTGKEGLLIRLLITLV
jgi:hypothetical protein